MTIRNICKSCDRPISGANKSHYGVCLHCKRLKAAQNNANRHKAAWETFIQKPLDKRWEIIFKDLYDRGVL